MTNLITDSDVVQKFVLVEWPHLSEEKQKLRCEQELADVHQQSIGYAIRNFATARAKFIRDDDPEIMRQSLGFIIYGNGGVHRYYVRANGEVCFSTHHSSEKGQERAVGQGFGLFN